MAYSNASDANVHLSNSEIVFADNDPESVAAFNEAERIVRGELSGYIDAATLTSWDFDPNVVSNPATPDEIRHIAGKLAASIRWRALYASNAESADRTYGQKLYDEAFAELLNVKNGDTIIVGVTLSGGTSHLTQDMFFPNDSTVATVDDRKFAMNQQF